MHTYELDFPMYMKEVRARFKGDFSLYFLGLHFLLIF